MTEASSEITEQVSKVPFSKRAAQLSILAPIISILINLAVGRQMTHRTGKIVVGSICMLFIVAGLSCAVIALFGIRKHGRKGILGAAIAGLLINGLFIVGSFALLDALQRVKASRMMSEEELMSLPDVLPNSVKIIDGELGFRFELPDGFYEFKEGFNRQGVVHSYARLSPADNRALVVTVERLGNIIRDLRMPDDAMKQISAMVPADSRVARIEVRWKERTIEGVALDIPVNGERATSYVVQVPLKLEAIQIIVAGSPGMEGEAKVVFDRILDSLAGRAIWE